MRGPIVQAHLKLKVADPSSALLTSQLGLSEISGKLGSNSTIHLVRMDIDIGTLLLACSVKKKNHDSLSQLHSFGYNSRAYGLPQLNFRRAKTVEGPRQDIEETNSIDEAHILDSYVNNNDRSSRS